MAVKVQQGHSPLAPNDPPVAPRPFFEARGEGLPYPAGVTRRKFVWPYLAAFLLFHALLPLAFVPWLFSWTGLILIPLGNYLFCSMGIGLGYHRCLTHRGLCLPQWLERSFALLGVCCLMESPARWVAIHRMHHLFADRQPDPHSPLAGFWWGHFQWLIHPNPATTTGELYERFAKDVFRDPFYFRLEKNSLWAVVYVLHAAAFFVAGLASGWWWSGTWWGGVQFGASLLLWGVIFRTIYTWHITWAVNSAGHCWGYRNYDTDDDSRNNWLVALVTNGEGWHNNHHADQVAAAHGHRWWEVDVTWLTILLLERLGLATNVKRPRQASVPPPE
jgi:stearoyl-CoA desaturase (delta-9 desaturase)